MAEIPKQTEQFLQMRQDFGVALAKAMEAHILETTRPEHMIFALAEAVGALLRAFNAGVSTLHKDATLDLFIKVLPDAYRDTETRD